MKQLRGVFKVFADELNVLNANLSIPWEKEDIAEQWLL